MYKSVSRGGPGLLRSQRSQSWSHSLDALGAPPGHTIDFQYTGKSDAIKSQTVGSPSKSLGKGELRTKRPTGCPACRQKTVLDVAIVVVFCLMVRCILFWFCFVLFKSCLKLVYAGPNSRLSRGRDQPRHPPQCRRRFTATFIISGCVHTRACIKIGLACSLEYSAHVHGHG